MYNKDNHDNDHLPLSSFLLCVHLSSSAGHCPIQLVQQKEAVGASSSTTSKLDDIKQRLVNSIENLLDIDNRHTSDIDNSKKQQQDSIMSSSDQPTTQAAAQATVQPTIVPSTTGTSATSILPQLNPVTINESNIIRQLNAVAVSMKLRDNNLYQTSSATLLNLYDNFSAVYFLANSTPPNLSGNEPIFKHINDFVNNFSAITTELFNSSSIRMVHLSNRGRTSTLPTTSTSSDSPMQPSSTTTTSSSFRQHQRDQLPHLRRQHSSNIRDSPSQRARRFNIVPLLFRAHRNRQLNIDKVPSKSRLHRARTNVRCNSGTNNRVGGATSTASSWAAQQQHSTSCERPLFRAATSSISTTSVHRITCISPASSVWSNIRTSDNVCVL